MPCFKSLPDNAIANHVWPLHPEAYDAWGPFVAAIMRTPSELSDGEKELIGAYASAMNGCRHCYSAHFPVAVVMGVAPEVFEAVYVDPWEAPVEERLKPLLAYTKKLCREPHKLSQEDADKVLEAGWSERALTDAIHIAAMFGYMNTIMLGHGADQQDLSGIGPLHTVLRESDAYGYDLTHEELLEKLEQARERFGDEAVNKALQEYLGFAGAARQSTGE